MIGKYNYGTGRRKSSVARVFMKTGKGNIIQDAGGIDHPSSIQMTDIDGMPNISVEDSSDFDRDSVNDSDDSSRERRSRRSARRNGRQ